MSNSLNIVTNNCVSTINSTIEFFTFSPYKYISTGVTSDSITIFWKSHTQDKLGLLLFLQET